MPNSVRLRNGEMHEYASPEETPAKMRDLLLWYQDNMNKLNPVQLAAEFHYKFVCIHPFDDGNGRVARLVMNYILYKNNYPPVIVKFDDKENYLTALQKADTGDKLALIEYIENQMIWSLELSIKAARGEEIEEYGDIEKQIELLKREKLTKSKIFKTPKVSFEIFNHIKNDIWIPLNMMLYKFKDFFAETKTEVSVNSNKLKVEDNEHFNSTQFEKLITDALLIDKHYEVYGLDMEKTDVNHVKWERKMLSFKLAQKKIDYNFSCNLLLNESEFVLRIEESNTDSLKRIVIFEMQKEYKTFFMDDEVESIIRIVSNHMLEIIKSEE